MLNLPPAYVNLTQRIKKDLRASGATAKVVQVLVGALAIPEGIIINSATSAISAAQSRWWWTLFFVALIHIILIAATLVSVTPLPQFLVEFDDIAENLKQAQAENVVSERFTQTYDAAMLATQVSLSLLDARQREPREDVAVPIEEVLKPWTNARSEIFWFQSGLYNFAVYLHDEATGKLKIVCRECDSRISRSDRMWPPGKGHVGVCFQQEKVYFSTDVSGVGEDNPIRTGESMDDKNYKAIISVPIFVDNVVRGVFVVTSSEAGQFVQELHSPIAQVVAILIGQAIKHGWTKKTEFSK